MSAVLTRSSRALVRSGLLIGPAAKLVSLLTIESLGPQDDDLRVDVADVVLSDTRLNVSAYNGFIVSPGGAQGFNNAWSTTGFRSLRLANPGTAGSPVRIWVTDVGGSVRLSPYRVTIDYADGTRRTLTAGRDLSFSPDGNPSTWPAGTTSLVPGELSKTSTQRDYRPPGSPAIWVPNGDFVL